MSLRAERQAARKAQALVTSLTPQTRRTDANAVAVRYAAGTAGDAVKNRPNEETLDEGRTEGGTVLGGLQSLTEVRAVTPDMIKRAREAVAASLRELATWSVNPECRRANRRRSLLPDPH